ncbi:MAG: TauD/TfdA family dioxygenase [Rhodospirillales bacterium]
MKITPLHPLIAAEATDIDLSIELTSGQVEDIRSAMDRHAVLVFRNQVLDDDQQRRFSEYFGPLEVSRKLHRKGYVPRLDKHMSDISNLDEKGVPLPKDDFRLLNMYANRLWHSDSSFKPVPARYSVLAAHVLPEHGGGNTEFADMRAAYDDLDAGTKARIENYICIHSIMNSREKLGYTDFDEGERTGLPPVRQVLVRTHPGSGRKSLYLASHAGSIEGLPIPEGRMILMDLNEHATQPKYVYSHQWQAGDVVMWDNRCTMHRGRWHDPNDIRDMRRTTISDEVPTVAQETPRQTG